MRRKSGSDPHCRRGITIQGAPYHGDDDDGKDPRRAAGREAVRAGEMFVNVDVLLTHDVCGPRHHRRLPRALREGCEGLG